MEEQISNELLNEIRQMQASMNISAGFSLEQIKEFTTNLEKVVNKTENNLTDLLKNID